MVRFVGRSLAPRKKMGCPMTHRFGVCLAAAVTSLAMFPSAGPASAANLPSVKVSDANKVAECATPGRLMAYLKGRNDKLDPKFDGVATAYMHHGESLGLRWDYAFFQMLLETGYLTYTGDVKPEQNNFAGLGATGSGARGESFKDVSTGVRAHLEHLLMYTGEKVENPVAERTRNIQDWGVLTSWQKTIQGPMTFTQLTKQWAPGSRGYASDIKTIADRFFNGACKDADPRPELVAAARGAPAANATTAQVAAATAPADVAGAQPKGAEIARRAVEQARADGKATRSGLGAVATGKPGQVVASSQTGAAGAKPSTTPPVTVLNAPPPEAAAAQPGKAAVIETASVAGAAKDAGKPDQKNASGKCRVWTASYGGAKAIIIKALADQMVNYTVLDVNEGTETREADAYISAYAKGGERMGEFSSEAQALDKAFELCPEG